MLISRWLAAPVENEVLVQAFWISTVFVFLIGACVGSFLNVCIYRMPLAGRSVLRPTFSFCFSCGSTLAWYDNIPLISYLWLWGRCRQCGAVYSSRYFWIELMTAALYGSVFWFFGPSLTYLTLAILGSLLIVIVFTDLDEYIIPNEVSYGGFAAGLILSLIAWWIHREGSPFTAGLAVVHPYYALGGALIGGGFLFLIGWLGTIAFRKEAMGFGDVKLLAMMGTFIGPVNIVLTIFLASIIGVVFSLFRMACNRVFDRRHYSYIPFGPYLALAGFLTIFIGRSILEYLFPPDTWEILKEIWFKQ